MAAPETAIRKRQQIANANRMMFIWVAAISAVVGISLVLSWLLFQRAKFNEDVLSQKGETATILTKNNAAIGALKDQVRVLNTNQALRDSMAPGEEQPIRVILDALPSDVNSAALASSIQTKFLDDPALKTESITVDPVAGVESQSDTSVVDVSSDTTTDENQITFRFVVSVDAANATPLKDLLQKLERSIRAIDVTSLNVESQGARLVLTVNGRAFYEPAKTADLKDKKV
jgi:hypothetical protein